MSIKNMKRNARSIYEIKYVICAKVLQDFNLGKELNLYLFSFSNIPKDEVHSKQLAV